MKCQVKENPAALLALSWYWATGGVGAKVIFLVKVQSRLLWE